MQRALRQTLLVSVIAWTLILSVYFISWKLLDSSLTQKTATTLDAYVRNESWNTWFEAKTPFRKGDILEYTFFLPGEIGTLLWIDLHALLERIEATSATLDGKPIDIKTLTGVTLPSNLSVLRIQWKTKTDMKDVPDANAQDLIQVQTIKKTIFEPIETKQTDESTLNKTNIVVNSDHFSSNKNEVLILSGSGAQWISSIVIGEKRFETHSVGSGSVFTVIDRGTFDSGTYFLGVTTQDSKLIPLWNDVTFTYDPSPIHIEAITPKTVSATKDSYVVIQWNGFSHLVSLQLWNGIVFKNAEFHKVNDLVVSVRIPKWLSPWEYSFNMMDASGIYSGTPKLTVTP